MKSEKLLDAIGGIDDALICAAIQPPAKKNTWLRWAAVAACLCLLAAALTLLPGQKPQLSTPPTTTILPTTPIPTTSIPIAEIPGTVPAPPQPPVLQLSQRSTAKVAYTDDYVCSAGNYLLPEDTEAEMFAMENLYIFRGTVLGLYNIVVDFDPDSDNKICKQYMCIAVIRVDKVFRGDIAVGDQLRMLLPCAIDVDDLWVEDTDTISRIEVGMEGIFMPHIYSETSEMSMGAKCIMLADLADCGLGDGTRWAFLQGAQRLIFADFAYPGAAGATTLEAIEAYISKMLA